MRDEKVGSRSTVLVQRGLRCAVRMAPIFSGCKSRAARGGLSGQAGLAGLSELSCSALHAISSVPTESSHTARAAMLGQLSRRVSRRIYLRANLLSSLQPPICSNFRNSSGERLPSRRSCTRPSAMATWMQAP